MSVWHGDLNKRKPSGGKKRANRTKRKYEKGSFPIETTHGETEKKLQRTRGGNTKTKAFSINKVNISNTSTGKTERTEITRVIKNPANVDYDRRGVITKGTIIETPLGTAKVTSRLGQDGIVNAIITRKET